MSTTEPTTAQARGMEVARTIMEQIGVMGRMSIGARQAVAYPDEGQWRGGVGFTVGRGRRRFRVMLAGDDTYTVTLYRLRRRPHDPVVEAEHTGIYCDQLTEVLITTLSESGEGQ